MLSKAKQSELAKLSPETQRAVALFWRHDRSRFYTGRMIRAEEEAVLAVPKCEMAAFVRLTTHDEE